ncbi:MAG: hypothetical protein KAY37_17500, partial [Phycisphaerae bacterium]|nr:hypothetical protein [Phycisphaerae bacterium]
MKRGTRKWARAAVLSALFLFALGVVPTVAQTESEAAPAAASGHGDDPIFVPDMSQWLPKADGRESLSNSLQILVLLTPVLISLPFKLLLFVLADGWHLVAGSPMASVSWNTEYRIQ